MASNVANFILLLAIFSSFISNLFFLKKNILYQQNFLIILVYWSFFHFACWYIFFALLILASLLFMKILIPLNLFFISLLELGAIMKEVYYYLLQSLRVLDLCSHIFFEKKKSTILNLG